MPHKIGAQFWFRSTLFEVEPNEDDETNPLCFGRQLANWMRARLIERGYSAEEVIPEDWGWCIMCARKPFMLWVGCVSVHNYEETQPTDPLPNGKDLTWSCMVTAETNILSSLLKRVSFQPALAKLSNDVDDVLRSEAEITVIEKEGMA